MADMRRSEEEAGTLTRIPASRKLVVRLTSGEVIKGYDVSESEVDILGLFENLRKDISGSIRMKLAGSDAVMNIPLREVKAIFHVRSFRGDPKRDGLRFYTNGPQVGGIWAEVRFRDNEVIEGTVENSAQHLLGDVLLLHPSDEQSNNLAVCINKTEIASYRVLGILPHRRSNGLAQFSFK